VTPGTLRQHAVAAEAIARGDMLFALYSGDPPPAEDAQLWLLPDGNEADAVAAPWQREAVTIATHAPGVRCRCSVRSAHPLDAGALGRIAGMHAWSDAYLTRRLASGERLHALIVRAWAAPQGPEPGDGAMPALPADDDLLPALTDAAFALLVARLEQALRG
jgi:hypothetical protein